MIFSTVIKCGSGLGDRLTHYHPLTVVTIVAMVIFMYYLIPFQDDQVTHANFVFVCLSDDAVVWLALSYVYKALLQLVAMFMAFYTRRVKIKALNDSKEIAVVIYFNSITLTLLAVVEFALKQYHEVYAALFSLALLVEASVFLTLIFIPKVQ